MKHVGLTLEWSQGCILSFQASQGRKPDAFARFRPGALLSCPTSRFARQAIAVTSSAEGVHSYPGVTLLCLLSVLRIDLWCPFANFPGIDDELERIRVLIFLH